MTSPSVGILMASEGLLFFFSVHYILVITVRLLQLSPDGFDSVSDDAHLHHNVAILESDAFIITMVTHFHCSGELKLSKFIVAISKCSLLLNNHKETFICSFNAI